MMFASTKSEDFSVIKNGVDASIEIIRHDATGFYNITKIAKLVNELKKKAAAEDNEVAGIPASSDKKVKKGKKAIGIPMASNKYVSKDEKCEQLAGIPASSNKYVAKLTKEWLRNQSTMELIETSKRLLVLDDVVYRLESGTPKKYSGTYVHELLYDQFMQWLDPEYAIKVSIILRSFHQDANKKILKEKNDKINKLHDDIADIKAMNARILQLAEKQGIQLDEQTTQLAIQSTSIDDLNANVDELKETVIKRTEHMTVDPDESKKVQYYAIIRKANNKLAVVGGQKYYVDDCIAGFNGDVAIGTTYIPNPTNFKVRLNKKIKTIYKADLAAYLIANSPVDKDDKKRLISKFNTIAPIRICYNSIYYNDNDYSEQDIADMVEEVANERYNQ